MPIISRFYGILIYMYWRDHSPPHSHAKYQGMEITVEIETGHVEGRISAKALRLVQKWRQLHKAELLQNWKCAEEKRVLMPIEPLE